MTFLNYLSAFFLLNLIASSVVFSEEFFIQNDSERQNKYHPVYLAQNDPFVDENLQDVQPNVPEVDENPENTTGTLLPSDYQPPMKNIFLNTLFGAITGALLGISVGTLVSGSDLTLAEVLDYSVLGASFGSVAGVSIGIYLSYNNLYFSNKPNATSRFTSDNPFTPPNAYRKTISLSYRF